MKKKYVVGVFCGNKVGVGYSLMGELGANNVLALASQVSPAPKNDLGLIVRTLKSDKDKELFFDCCLHVIICVVGLEGISMLAAGIGALAAKKIETLAIIGCLDLEMLIALGEEEEQRDLRLAIEEGKILTTETFSLPEWRKFSKI